VRGAVEGPFGLAHTTFELECERCADPADDPCGMDELTAPSGGRAATVAAIITVIALSTWAAAVAAQQNLFVNGGFAKGAGTFPDHWRTEGWDQKPETTTFRWIEPAGVNPGEIEVNSVKPNDARYQQTTSLVAGWYYLSVEARTEEVGGGAAGATISVLEDGITSGDLTGTKGWSKLGLYLKVGPHGADVEVALRLGGYASLNTGRAFFRNASAIRVAGPPAGATHTFDLEAIRKASQPLPVGKPWSLVATFILLGSVAVAGWRMFGEATMQPAGAKSFRIPEKPTEKPPPKPVDKTTEKPAEKPRDERKPGHKHKHRKNR